MAMAMAMVLHLLAVLGLAISCASAHNISDILSPFPEYSLFNSYLSKTKLSDDINHRHSITVLALRNGSMSSLIGVSSLKHSLSLHVLLDYFDPPKLHNIPNGSTLSTSLFQTTGLAPDRLGFVNISALPGGRVVFSSPAPGSSLVSFVKAVKLIPYNISVLEISAPIGIINLLPAPSDVLNLTASLQSAGCHTFASLLLSTGVLKAYSSSSASGLTVFAPNDAAFRAVDLSVLTDAQVVALLQYHALPTYAPIATLRITHGPITTLASTAPSNFQLRLTTAGDSVTLHTALNPSRIASVVLDSTPVSIFTVDNVLLPEELFGNSPAPAPSPVPATSSTSPTPAQVEAPSLAALSPPAPPTETPEEAPADAPDADSENISAGHVEGRVWVVLLWATVISSLFMLF